MRFLPRPALRVHPADLLAPESILEASDTIWPPDMIPTPPIHLDSITYFGGQVLEIVESGSEVTPGPIAISLQTGVPSAEP